MKKKVKKRGRSRYQRRLSAMALARLLILIMIVVPLQSMGGLAPGKVYASEYAAGKSAIIRIKDEGRADASESTGTEGNVSRSGISGKSRTSDQTDQINGSADKTGAAAAEERSGGKGRLSFNKSFSSSSVLTSSERKIIREGF